jgi:Ca2+-binding RTX toxin-like protein
MNQNTFKKVSSLISGIDDIGQSWGAAWGDFNGDRLPDLWVNNHFDAGVLYINQGDGTFKDRTDKIFLVPPGEDKHGTAWIDFDNDGDQDLINLVGSGRGLGIGPEYDNQFYINEGGKLEDLADSLNLSYSLARGRSPLWFDFNNDGRLDVFVGAISRLDSLEAPATIFLQKTDGRFQKAVKITGFQAEEAPFAILSDLSGDGKLDFIVATKPSLTVYDTSSLPLKNITATTIPNAIQNATDLLSADFNGDLRPDLYLTRRTVFDNELYRQDINSLATKLFVEGEQKGIYFDTKGKVTFDIVPTKGPGITPLAKIYIGSSGITPNSEKFTLSPDNPKVQGILPHIPGVDEGIYIGYDATLQRWRVLLSSNATSGASTPQKNSLLAFIETTGAIVESAGIGFDDDAPLNKSQLLINTPQGFVNRSDKSGINSILASAEQAVAGDFDNDMDEDIYVVTSRIVANTPDILYENQGDGTFVAVSKSGGAKGSSLGAGDFVTSVDYDLDGFLDLLVSNGDTANSSLQVIEDARSYDLFQNQGNNNHWLEIDLRGVVSNRDGIGAQVFLTAGGVTQMRQQAGGMHNDVQNSQRIHFGLADNTQVEELVIQWSSGRRQTIEAIPSDRLIKVVEILDDKNDRFSSGNSNDVLNGDDGDDLLNGNDGQDILVGGLGNDTLNGGNNDDLLRGGDGDDNLNGGDGNDVLQGATGIDSMKGGLGKDSFRFSSYQGELNIIRDFVVADDTIQVSAAGFGGGLVGDRAITAEQLRIGSTATNSQQRFIYNPANGDLSFDRDGSDSAFEQIRFASLRNALAITNKDIFVIN